MVKAAFYTPPARPLWDEFASKARQSSFLFQRGFMDYHSDCFRDRSLLFTDEKERLIALLPACESPSEQHTIVSHAGLTYGGLLTSNACTVTLTGEILDAAFSLYRAADYRKLIYKPVPHIYHRYPSEEDLYGLFQRGAKLEKRAVSSAIDLTDPFPFSTLRRRKVRRAQREERLTFKTGTDYLPQFWEVLTEVLLSRHGVRPVHSLEEITRLTLAFPDKIKLFIVLKDDETLLAGALMFESPTVTHVQYIAASDEGRETGALDALFDYLITLTQSLDRPPRYFDFGISTERGGRFLNEGLVFQKEGFGARAVCYDEWSVTL